MANVAEIVTQEFLERLEKGTIPWKRGWDRVLPYNALSGKEYSGINRLLLNIYEGPGFLTFKQIQTLGGKVKKGAKSRLVVFYRQYEPKNPDYSPDGTVQKKIALRYYRVFGLENTEGLPEKYYAAEKTPPDYGDFSTLIRLHDVKVTYGGSNPVFIPSENRMTLPPFSAFTEKTEFYVSFFHELSHWTGHNGLERKFSYAEEELVAEISAMTLCSAFKKPIDIDNSTAYCAAWAKRIKGKEANVLKCAAAAQRCVDFIMQPVGEI